MGGQAEDARHYRRPSWFTNTFLNRPVAGLTRAGLSLWGSRVLEVRGRRTGEPRRVAVNLHPVFVLEAAA